MDMTRRVSAEFFGTFWLTFAGCGSAVLAAAFPQLGIGFVGVSLAFGLTVLTMAYAVGHISGGHFNPAVTIGLWAAGRFKTGDIIQVKVLEVDVARKRISLTMKLDAPSGHAGGDKGARNNRFEHAGRDQRTRGGGGYTAPPQSPQGSAMASAFAKLQGLKK